MWTFWATAFFCHSLAVWSARESTFYNVAKCGKSVGCWYFPDGCKDESCHAIIRWKMHKNLLRIELQAKDVESKPGEGRYMALGFSEDKYMDNDTVIECVFNGNGKAKAFVSYNDHSTNIQLEDASTKLVKLKRSAVSDGRLLCKIDHKKLKEAERRKIISSVKHRPWTLLFAQGLADSKTREKFIHAFYPWSTDEKVEMCVDCEKKNQVVTETSPHQEERLKRSSKFFSDLKQ